MQTGIDNNLFVAGTIISNRYEVISSLGAGGVGTVAKVIDRHLDNELCALKILFPHLASDKIQFARFRNEVLVARRLSHPNIVRVYDFGSAGQGYYYITMQYVEGGSLGDRIYSQRYQPLSFEDKIRILHEICSGLACAHQQGVVHRDLKPDNILLDDLVHVRISDFGLAKSLNVDKGFTDTGETVGTPYYMAPEQLRGLKPDPRMDLYSLGILAFELVAGRRPFFHEDYFALARMHLQDPMPLLATPESGIPQWYQEWLDRLTEKDPDKRYQTAAEAASVLADNLHDPQNLTVRRLPVLQSLYGAKKRARKKTSKKHMKKIVSAVLLSAAVLAGSLAIVRSSSTIQSKLQPLLVKAGSGSLLHVITGSTVSGSDLFRSIQTDDAGAFNNLVLSGVDPDLEDGAGTTALIHTILNENLEFADLLIEKGADVNKADANGRRPLAHAIIKGDINMVSALLKARADISATDGMLDLSMLMLAAKEGQAGIVERLLKSRASTSARDKNGRTALFYAVKAEDIALVQRFIELGSSPDTKDKDGNTPLIEAVKTHNDNLIRQVLDADSIDVTITNNEGKSAKDYGNRSERRMLKERMLTVKTPSRTQNRVRSAPAPSSASLGAIGRADAKIINVNGVASLEVTARVRNSGASEASRPRVIARFSDGSSLTLSGPEKIRGYETKTYSAVRKGVPNNHRRVRIEASCENC